MVAHQALSPCLVNGLLDYETTSATRGSRIVRIGTVLPAASGDTALTITSHQRRNARDLAWPHVRQ